MQTAARGVSALVVIVGERGQAGSPFVRRVLARLRILVGGHLGGTPRRPVYVARREAATVCIGHRWLLTGYASRELGS